MTPPDPVTGKEGTDKEVLGADPILHFLSEDKPIRWLLSDKPQDKFDFYTLILPDIRKAAERCGYAVAVHGSMRRDFDLIAAPWKAGFSEPDYLAREIQKAGCGAAHGHHAEKDSIGRLIYNLFVGRTAYIDLNVIIPDSRKAEMFGRIVNELKRLREIVAPVDVESIDELLNEWNDEEGV